MDLRSSSPSHTYTRLYARILEEEGAFIVSIRMLNHLKLEEKAWGEETAASFDIASGMIAAVARQFCISQDCISIKISMENFKDGILH